MLLFAITLYLIYSTLIMLIFLWYTLAQGLDVNPRDLVTNTLTKIFTPNHHLLPFKYKVTAKETQVWKGRRGNIVTGHL